MCVWFFQLHAYIHTCVYAWTTYTHAHTHTHTHTHIYIYVYIYCQRFILTYINAYVQYQLFFSFFYKYIYITNIAKNVLKFYIFYVLTVSSINKYTYINFVSYFFFWTKDSRILFSLEEYFPKKMGIIWYYLSPISTQIKIYSPKILIYSSLKINAPFIHVYIILSLVTKFQCCRVWK